MANRVCQNCHGQGVLTVEVKPGVWRKMTCSACGGRGVIPLPNI